jgi:hypothetical protein
MSRPRIEIWKHQLSSRENRILVPKGSVFLDTQSQCGRLVIWSVGNVTEEEECRLLNVVGTGWLLEEPVGTYVATVQQGPFAWHVFDRGVVA